MLALTRAHKLLAYVDVVPLHHMWQQPLWGTNRSWKLKSAAHPFLCERKEERGGERAVFHLCEVWALLVICCSNSPPLVTVNLGRPSLVGTQSRNRRISVWMRMYKGAHCLQGHTSRLFLFIHLVKGFLPPPPPPCHVNSSHCQQIWLCSEVICSNTNG